MMDAKNLIETLRDKGAGLFTGVPDSLLGSFCAVLEAAGVNHLPAPNEGNAVALAAGHFLATGRPAVVYMQNSGLGNAVNPLASLTDPEVYSIPMLLVVGWRGEPGVPDEPQHVKQGRITPGLLELLEIPYRIIDADSNAEEEADQAWAAMMDSQGPSALLIRADSFTKISAGQSEPECGFRREAAIEKLLNMVNPEDLLVATTGKTGRELYELRAKRGEPLNDFLTVGSMGHASSIALGAALARPDRRLICLDGDGAALMHLGALALIGAERPANFIHILLNNHCHESVGGQPTCGLGLNFAAAAKTCGYRSGRKAANLEEIEAIWADIDQSPGPHFLEIDIAPGARNDLGRPKNTPRQCRDQFMAKF